MKPTAVLRRSTVWLVPVVTMLLLSCQPDFIIPPATPDLDVQVNHGSIALPAFAAVSSRNLTVSSSFGSSRVKTSGDFQVPTNQNCGQLVTVTNPEDELVLLAIAPFGANPGGQSFVIDARATAISLVLMHPLLADPDMDYLQAFTAALSSMSEIDALAAGIESQLNVIGHIDLNDGTMAMLYQLAVNKGIEYVLGGGPPTLSVLPTYDQSWVTVQVVDDSVASDVRLRILNWAQRWVELWATPLDADGNEVGATARVGFIPSADDFSVAGAIFGALLTGEILGPSETSISVSIPSNADSARLEAWGLGFTDLSSAGSFSEFTSKAGIATLATLLCDIGAPTLDMLVGIKLATRGPGRPTAVFEWLNKVSDCVEISGIFLDVASGEIDKAGKAAFDLVKFLIKNPEGRQILVGLASEFGITGITETVLKNLIAPLRAIGFVENAINLAWTTVSISSCSPREDFMVRSGDGGTGFVFQVTLSWDKPTDMDLHTFTPGGHSWYGSKSVSSGELDFDDVNGFGPENFTARIAVPGIYRIAINYYSGSEPVNVRIRVQSPSIVENYGPYSLATANYNGGYPVSGSTASWWRPCDISVGADGSVVLLPPDDTTLMRSLLMMTTSAGVKGR